MEELRDIHLPNLISWWPPAIGWWAVLLVLFAVLFLLYRYFAKPRMKTEALSILSRIEENYDDTHDAVKCLRELSVLLRRVAITQKKESAGLTGPAWLEHLDQGLKEPEFSRGAGKLLLTGPYQVKAEEQDLPELLALCRKWVEAK